MRPTLRAALLLWLATGAVARAEPRSVGPTSDEADEVAAPAEAPGILQRVAELEWSRAEPVQLVAELPGADASTRRVIARALGRLRDPGTVDTLAELVRDVDPAVQLEAASALGWTPGTALMLRHLLEETVVPARAFGVPSHEAHLVARLLRGLGHQGTSRDVALLRRRVHEPWPVGEAAAHALGRLGLRGVPAVAEAVPDLAQQLASRDGRRSEAAAFALRRIGVDAQSVAVEPLALAVTDGATTATRAWSLQAVWRALDPDQRVDLFLEAASSSRRQLQVVAFDVLQPGDLDGTVVGAWTRDPDPWVRQASVAALGRLGDSDESLEAIAAEADPFAAAGAIQALGRGDAAVAADPERPVPLRAAHALGLDDPEALLALAQNGPPPVQSSAAMALTALVPLPSDVLDALHSADDPLLREVAVGALVAAEGPGLVPRLLRWARDEEHPEVQASLAEALVAQHDADGRALRGQNVASLVARLAEHAVPRAQQAAVALAEAGRVDRPTLVPRRLPASFGPPPTHDAHERAEGWPSLADLAPVVGARVATDHGDFVLTLDTEVAPMAVYAFVALAEVGFYDGLPLHRVVPGFVAQGGDPRGDGWGGPGWSLPDEVSALPFSEGSVGMARGGPDSGGSQWFVTTTDQPHLVGAYTRFGEVVEGLYRVQRMPVGTVVTGIDIELRHGEHEP